MIPGFGTENFIIGSGPDLGPAPGKATMVTMGFAKGFEYSPCGMVEFAGSMVNLSEQRSTLISSDPRI